jgi:hypothetical protein
VEVVVDTAGAVEPCSVRLVSTTNRAWGVEIEQWARGGASTPRGRAAVPYGRV